MCASETVAGETARAPETPLVLPRFAGLHLKWLWLRHSYTFNWAHKPLCERYRHNVLRLGRMHLCRSCICLYVGFVAALIAWISGVAATLPAGVYVAAGVLIIGLSVPALYRRLPRLMRDALRLSTGALLPLSVCLATGPAPAVGIGGLLVLGAAYWAYARLRDRQKRLTCSGCKELDSDDICSGYELQAECIRMHERTASDYLTGVARCRGTPR